MAKNRIKWVEPNVHKKTRIAYNQEGERLGILCLTMIGRHKHWCWYQEQFVYMSPSCLDEVRAKQKELFKFRKGQLR